MLGPKPELPSGTRDDVDTDKKNINVASLYLVNTFKLLALNRINGNKQYIVEKIQQADGDL